MASNKITLNNGQEIPIVGMETDVILKPNEYKNVIAKCVDIGYNFFHLSPKIMGLHAEFVAALKGIKKLNRNDLFISSEVFCTSEDDVFDTCKQYLAELGLEYFDLLLLSGATEPREVSGNESNVQNDSQQWQSTNPIILAAWKGLERCCKAGLTRSIGTAKFDLETLKKVLKICEIKPAINKLDPDVKQHDVVLCCKDNDITVCTLIPPAYPFHLHPVLYEVLNCFASHHKKTVSQVLLQYAIQCKTFSLIPMNLVDREWVYSMDIATFELDGDELNSLRFLL